MQATPKIYTAFRFFLAVDGNFDYESLLVPAITSSDAETLLRQWGDLRGDVYLQTDDHMVIAEESNASPIRVYGAYTRFDRPTQEEHRRWVDVHTNSYKVDGEMVPASYRLVK